MLCIFIVSSSCINILHIRHISFLLRNFFSVKIDFTLLKNYFSFKLKDEIRVDCVLNSLYRKFVQKYFFYVLPLLVLGLQSYVRVPFVILFAISLHFPWSGTFYHPVMYLSNTYFEVGTVVWYIKLKNSRPCQDLSPGPTRYLADMLPTELSWLGYVEILCCHFITTYSYVFMQQMI